MNAPRTTTMTDAQQQREAHEREQWEAEQMTNKYAELAAVNVGDKIEKKGKLSYLSWAWAVDQLFRHDASASWAYGEPQRWGDDTVMVSCTVTAFGAARTMQLPVMDHHNKAISNPDAFAVNTAMQRCLVKAIALHGLGLYIYAGEDLPPGEDGDKGGGGYTPSQDAALQSLREASLNGMAALEAAWKGATPALRMALKDELPSLKEAAAKAEQAAA